MATTLAQFVSRFRKRVGSPSTTALSDDDAKEYINRGYMHSMDHYMHPAGRAEYTFTTVAGTATYTIPRTYRALIRLWDKDYGRRVHKVTHTRLFELRSGDNAASTGKPAWYYKNGDSLMLLPTPDAAYEMIALCKVKVADLDADDDEPVIDDWDSIILARGVYEYYLDIGDEPKAKWALSVWLEAVGSKPTQLEEEQVDQEIPASGVDLYKSGSGNFRRRMNSDPWNS